MGLRLPKFFGPSVKRASRVKPSFKGQVVEAIRISYELAGSATDHAELSATLVALERVIDAAVNVEDQPENAASDKLNEFVSCLKDESMVERMASAKSKDNKKATQSAAQSLRLDNLLEKVKQTPLLRSKHFFAIADPRHDVIVDIPYDAKLPAILWKFHRVCGKDTPINPHFYPLTPFEEEEVITPILPLRDRNTNKNGEKWTERIFVYGDNREGRIRLTSGDGTITRLFGAVTECLTRPLTLFKDSEGHLLAEDEVDQLFLRTRNLKCFRWQDSSFVIDPDVRTVQDVIKSQEKKLVSSPLSMEPTESGLPELGRSVSALSATLSNGSSRVNRNRPSSVGTSSILPVKQPQGFMGHRAQYTSGNSTIYTQSEWFTEPPRQEVSSGSPPTPIAPRQTVQVDSYPRPPHPPPTIPGPGKGQSSSPSVTPEQAKAQQVESSKETKLSTAAANGGAELAAVPGSSGITTLATAEPWRNGAPTTNYEQTGSAAIDIPRPTGQSRPPLFVPTRSYSQDGSTISSSPAPSSLGSSRVDTPLSIATSLSPSLFTNPQTSNSPPPEAPAASVNKPPSKPPAEESYGTVIIRKPNPTQLRQSTPPQSRPSSTLISSPPAPKGSEKPSPPTSLRQADKRSFWRRTADGVADWWAGPKK